MILLEEIDKSIVKSDSSELPENFVAVAVQLNVKGTALHSGLIISVNGKCKLFHFDVDEVIYLQDVPSKKWYFHKELSIIKPQEAAVFLARCEMIANTANPRFGFFYDGSYYDEKGKLISKSNSTEFTNCVLFCINVILGFIESDSYILFNDWSSDKISDGFFHDFCSRKKLFMSETELEKLRAILLRIPPLDYTATAFKNTLPIGKADILEEVKILEEVFKSKVILPTFTTIS
ncbi:MAG: hypothetical protein V4608_09965 [Bacteroidota bacterium]